MWGELSTDFIRPGLQLLDKINESLASDGKQGPESPKQLADDLHNWSKEASQNINDMAKQVSRYDLHEVLHRPNKQLQKHDEIMEGMDSQLKNITDATQQLPPAAGNIQEAIKAGVGKVTDSAQKAIEDNSGNSTLSLFLPKEVKASDKTS